VGHDEQMVMRLMPIDSVNIWRLGSMIHRLFNEDQYKIMVWSPAHFSGISKFKKNLLFNHPDDQ
jgi:hypothetical protein